MTGISCQCVKSWWLNSLEWHCGFQPPPPIYCFPRPGKLCTLEGTSGARVSMISLYCFPRGLNGVWMGFFFSLCAFSSAGQGHTCIYMQIYARSKSLFWRHAMGLQKVEACSVTNLCTPFTPSFAVATNLWLAVQTESWIACVLLFTS